MICSWFGFMNWKINFWDVWFCFDYCLICFSLFCRFCLFFFRRRRHNKFILCLKKNFKNPIFLKNKYYTHLCFFNKLLLTENFMICFFVENNEKSYVTIFIEKSSAFMKITLLFYYFLWFYYGDVGGKQSQKTQKINKKHKMNHIKCTVNTFRNRLWPFNRTRSDKKHLVFTRLLLFFWGADFPNNLRTLLSGLFGSVPST